MIIIDQVTDKNSNTELILYVMSVQEDYQLVFNTNCSFKDEI
jgi:hypothetical protein